MLVYSPSADHRYAFVEEARGDGWPFAVEEASSVGFKRSVVYGMSTLRVVARYLLHRSGIRRSRQLLPRSQAREPGTA